MPVKHFLRYSIPSILTVAILWILFQNIPIAAVWANIVAANRVLLVWSFFLLLCIHPLFALRWQISLQMAGYSIAYGVLFRAYLANLPISKITPAYSGDFLRSVQMKQAIPVVTGAGVIFFEAVYDIFLLAVCSLFFGMYIQHTPAVIVGVVVGLGIVGTLVVAQRVPLHYFGRYAEKIESFFKIFSQARHAGKLLVWFSILSVVMLGLLFGFFAGVFAAFGTTIPWQTVAALYPVVNLISILPITVWGVGVRESSMVYIFAQVAPSTTIAAVSLTYSFIGLVLWPLVCSPFTYSAIMTYIRHRRISES